MDKKDKMLILLAPIAVIAGGYLLFGDRLFPEEKTVTVPKDDFTAIEAPITEVRKKRTEIYRAKYEKENGALERNIESDDSFFGSEEIKGDAVDATLQKNDEETTEFEDAPLEKKQPPKEEKVIVKYIERPEKKTVTQEQEPEVIKPVTQEKPSRRRTGFAGGNGDSKVAETVVSDANVSAIEVPVVVQDDISVKQGSNITLRTTEETTVNGKIVAKNTLITGVVSLTDQRFNVAVSTIKSSSGNIAVKLKGYDPDGNEGFPLEGGVDKEIKRDVVNDAINATRTVVKVPILSATPSRVGQKKLADPTVPVPKGYKIFLKQ